MTLQTLGVGRVRKNAPAPQNNQRWEIRKQAGWGMGGALLFGLIVVTWRQAHHSDKLVPTALLWCLACTAMGCIIGFLFGIPRALQRDFTTATPVEPGNSTVSGKQVVARYQVNTNLEQISDWLTKIFVGLGLVELQKMPERLSRMARAVSSGLVVEGGKDAGAFAFAMAILLYFPTLGFLGGYLLTRLYLGPAFAKADVETELPVDPEQKTEVSEAKVDLQTGEVAASAEQEAGVRSAARQIIKVPLNEISDPADIATWAKSQMFLRNYEQAVSGYARAVSLLPDNPQLQVEYGIALFRAGRRPDSVLQQLERAHALLTPASGEDVHRQVFSTLMFHALYLDRPESFTRVINYWKEYGGSRAYEASSAMQGSLAEAYLQRYAWLRKRNEPGERAQMEEARQEALKLIRDIVAREPSMRERLARASDGLPRRVREDEVQLLREDPEIAKELGI